MRSVMSDAFSLLLLIKCICRAALGSPSLRWFAYPDLSSCLSEFRVSVAFQGHLARCQPCACHPSEIFLRERSAGDLAGKTIRTALSAPQVAAVATYTDRFVHLWVTGGGCV